MKFPFKIRAIRNGSGTPNYKIGDVLTAIGDTPHRLDWQVEEYGLSVAKANFEIMKEEEFKPESGMTFECANGDRGVILEAPGYSGGSIKYLQYFFTKKAGELGSRSQFDYADGSAWPYWSTKDVGKRRIVKIFQGLHYHRAALTNLYESGQGKVVWEAKPPTIELTLEQLAERARVKIESFSQISLSANIVFTVTEHEK